MTRLKHSQVLALPDVLEAGTIYYVDNGDGTCTEYVTNTSGTIAARQVVALMATEPTFTADVISIGDSITYGDRAGGPANAWPGVLGHLRHWAVTNQGINGSALVHNGYQAMVDRYAAEVPAGFAGHVTLMAGANDYTQNLPLGNPGSTDPGTIYGALLVMGRGILTRAPGCLLHLLTPLWRGDTPEGTRNNQGYTMEQVRQAVRDVAAQLSREYPQHVQLHDLGRELADWLSNGTAFMDSDHLHPNAAGHTLIGQHLAMQMRGADGIEQPVASLLYSRTFASRQAGDLNGQDGWTVDSGSYTVGTNGLTVNAAWDSNPIGAHHALPIGATRARILVASGSPMLRFRMQDNKAAYGIWILDNRLWDWGQLDTGGETLYGPSSWFPSNPPAIPAYPVWLEIEQVGSQMHARVWHDGAMRPDSPLYTKALGADSTSSLLSGGQISLAHVDGPAVVSRIEVS